MSKVIRIVLQTVLCFSGDLSPREQLREWDIDAENGTPW